MSAIRIRKKIDSETLILPELRPLIGRTVEILIEEPSLPPGFSPGTGDRDQALAASQTLEDYDYDAYHDLKAGDLRGAEEKLR